MNGNKHRTARLMLWAGPLFAIVVTAALFAIGYYQEENETVDLLQTGIVYGIICVAIVVWFLRYQSREREEARKNLSKKACLYSANQAARLLVGGNTVTASLFVDKMLRALSDLLKVRSVYAGSYFVPARSAMYITPNKIPQKAVFRVVQNPDKGVSIMQKLEELEMKLKTENNMEYEAAQDFLFWLEPLVDTVREQSETFFDRHLLVRDLLKYLPTAAAVIGAIYKLIETFISNN